MLKTIHHSICPFDNSEQLLSDELRIVLYLETVHDSARPVNMLFSRSSRFTFAGRHSRNLYKRWVNGPSTRQNHCHNIAKQRIDIGIKRNNIWSSSSSWLYAESLAGWSIQPPKSSCGSTETSSIDSISIDGMTCANPRQHVHNVDIRLYRGWFLEKYQHLGTIDNGSSSAGPRPRITLQCQSCCRVPFNRRDRKGRNADNF